MQGAEPDNSFIHSFRELTYANRCPAPSRHTATPRGSWPRRDREEETQGAEYVWEESRKG